MHVEDSTVTNNAVLVAMYDAVIEFNSREESESLPHRMTVGENSYERFED